MIRPVWPVFVECIQVYTRGSVPAATITAGTAFTMTVHSYERCLQLLSSKQYHITVQNLYFLKLKFDTYIQNCPFC
jgi:hypothetical protein